MKQWGLITSLTASYSVCRHSAHYRVGARFINNYLKMLRPYVPYFETVKSFNGLHSLVVECWLRVLDVQGAIQSLGLRHTIDFKDGTSSLALNIKRETLALSQIAIKSFSNSNNSLFSKV